MLVSSSPERFAGHRVLLRLSVPRYPPLALCNLTSIREVSAFPSFTLFRDDYAVFKVLTGRYVQQSELSRVLNSLSD